MDVIFCDFLGSILGSILGPFFDFFGQFFFYSINIGFYSINIGPPFYEFKKRPFSVPKNF